MNAWTEPLANRRQEEPPVPDPSNGLIVWFVLLGALTWVLLGYRLWP